jgi:multiple sugar transport system substrate-binding protein
MSEHERLRGGKGLSRRQLIGTALGAAAAGLVPVGRATPAGGAQAFDWKRYAGQQVRFIGLKSIVEAFWRESLPDFEKQTGIKVAFEEFEQAQARQKLATELVARTGTLDTFRTTKMQDFQQYWRNGWYEVLDPYIADATKTHPELNMPDFFSGALDACKIDGKLIALPVTSGAQILMYRRDLLEEKGLKVPASMEDLEAAARALHNPPNVYGVASRGQKSAAVSMFAAFLHNFGADWMAGGKPSLQTPEALAAYTFYGRLLRQYGPPGVVNMSHVELSPMFAQGKAAMFLDDLSHASIFEDEKKSKVVGRVGYAKFPAGPKRDQPTIYVYGMAMSSQSKHKEATWYWIQWASGAVVQAQGMLKGVSGARASAWNSPEFQKTAKKDWLEAARTTLQKGNDEWAPPVISVPEARDIVGLPITVAIEGGDVKAACEKASKGLEALARRDGVLK